MQLGFMDTLKTERVSALTSFSFPFMAKLRGSQRIMMKNIDDVLDRGEKLDCECGALQLLAERKEALVFYPLL